MTEIYTSVVKMAVNMVAMKTVAVEMSKVLLKMDELTARMSAEMAVAVVTMGAVMG